jgi:hypothetical protein
MPSKLPHPSTEYRKVSNMEVRGFNDKINLYLSGATLIGYIIGVAYMKSCIPNVISFVKSRYFVVMEEMINPHDMDSIANKIIRYGKSKIDIFMWIGASFTTQYM